MIASGNKIWPDWETFPLPGTVKQKACKSTLQIIWIGHAKWKPVTVLEPTWCIIEAGGILCAIAFCEAQNGGPGKSPIAPPSDNYWDFIPETWSAQGEWSPEEFHTTMEMVYVGLCCLGNAMRRQRGGAGSLSSWDWLWDCGRWCWILPSLGQSPVSSFGPQDLSSLVCGWQFQGEWTTSRFESFCIKTSRWKA